MPFRDGVIDEALPGSGVALPPDWALQNPQDWIAALEATVAAVLTESGIAPAQISGIGIDFTACTLVPTTADGKPLSTLDGNGARPHAWCKLWKHHGAQAQADRVNALAIERGEPWLPRYGGLVSSEWLVPKALQILEEDPEMYAAAAHLVEGGDWVVWQLTGALARNACAAGYKATWHKEDGFPSVSFLAALHPELAGVYEQKVSGPVLPPGHKVGELTEVWAQRLGLAPGIAVAAPIIDAHAAAIGGGVSGPGALFMIMGTSTCHMLMAAEEKHVAGISGVVADGIVPGHYGYEAGQAGVGDIFGWYVEHGVPTAFQQRAAAQGISLHDLLSQEAAALRPGESGLLALDWWNGCRTPLVDADLSGALLGCTLATRPEEIYRALIEATAFGTRLIIELFAEAAVPVGSVRVGGGLTQNELLLSIYADVTGLPLEVSGAEQASAQGAAILGAVAAGLYPSVSEAAGAMAPPPGRIVPPRSEHGEAYTALYAEYKRLVDLFGRDPDSPLKRLRALRQQVAGGG